MSDNNQSEREMTVEEKLEFLLQQNIQLHQRIAVLENFLQLKFNVQPVVYGEGQRQIRSDPNRTESGQGPILNTNSEFL